MKSRNIFIPQASKGLGGHMTKFFILGLDLLFSLIAITSALMIIGQFELTKLNGLLTWGPVLLLFFRTLSFVYFRTYLLIVRYIGEKDYKNIFYAVTASSFIFFLLLRFLATPFREVEVLPIVLVDYFILLFLTGGFRIFLRLAFDRMRLQGVNRLNTAIFGAGELGAMIQRVLKHHDAHNYRVVAFFDDNMQVHRKYLNGVRIHSPAINFEKVIRDCKIKYAIIGVNDLPESRRIEFINACLANQVKVLKVPPMENWINDSLNVGQLKKINVEDLLNRPPIKLNQEGIRSGITGKVVLVTGCAGSIGSEIVRQLLEYKPAVLLGLDQAETPLADITLELKKEVASGVFKPIIGDIREEALLAEVFERYRPDYVFHAAAYKHVPIMERHPFEAVQTNIRGTMNVANQAANYGAEKFVMISTDKAVNPSNVMGASKRIAEIYVQALNYLNDHNTQFITTRFGNVLGSNGSVIPIFKRQIEERKPLTVTHPEITRFFMTIPEACQLVLEAGSMGKGGEIFVFDMGKPVKILDLAKQMIKLSGLIPGQDIEIKFSGLRPGEKLYEELLDNQEGLIKTHHEKIKKAAVRINDYESVKELIDQLVSIANNKADAMDLVALMKYIVPEFVSRNSVYEKLDGKATELSPNRHL